MNINEIVPGAVYEMDKGQNRHVVEIKNRYHGPSVTYHNVLKNGKLGLPRYCLVETFARKAVRVISSDQ